MGTRKIHVRLDGDEDCAVASDATHDGQAHFHENRDGEWFTSATDDEFYDIYTSRTVFAADVDGYLNVLSAASFSKDNKDLVRDEEGLLEIGNQTSERPTRQREWRKFQR